MHEAYQPPRAPLCRLALGAALLFAAACGSDDPDVGPDARTGADAPIADAAPVDARIEPDAMPSPLGPGEWTTENVSQTPGTIATQSDLAITDSGTVFVVWSESDSENVSDQDILVATGGDGTWKTDTLTTDVGVQNTYPSILTDGDTVHLVWSGYPDGWNDIYYTVHTPADGWRDPVDLTAAFESALERDAFAPALAIGPNGELAIAYQSGLRDVEGEFRDPTEIRVIRIANGAVIDGPVTVIEAVGAGCNEPDLAFDAAGALHLVAACGAVLQGDIYYTTDAGGSFAEPVVLPGNAGKERFRRKTGARCRW